MEWLWWLLLLPLAIPVGLLLREPGSILRPLSKPKAPKVYQEVMTPRHTEVRKAETRVELANWDVDFSSLEVKTALKGFAPLDGLYVSSSVLTWCYEHDRDKFDIFMAHNNRLDIQNLGYSGAEMIQRNSDISGGYDGDEYLTSKYYGI